VEQDRIKLQNQHYDRKAFGKAVVDHKNNGTVKKNPVTKRTNTENKQQFTL
jgi:hypothetical protein